MIMQMKSMEILLLKQNNGPNSYRVEPAYVDVIIGTILNNENLTDEQARYILGKLNIGDSAISNYMTDKHHK